MRVKVGSVAFLAAALIGAVIGALLAFVPAANAWAPVWAAAVDPALARPPAAELYRMAADGSGQARLTISDVDERSPAVSPDGTRVAVKLWPEEGEVPQTLAVIDLHTGERVDLLTEGIVNQPSWSPDGERVLFGWNPDNAVFQLWWIAADGSAPPERLMDSEADSYAGQWSPDGERLLFSSDRDGFGIYVANADGTDAHKIVDHPRYADAAWSPDSQLIAFTSDEEGDFGLSVVAPDGSGLRLVHVVPGAVLIPDWSPDGQTLVYESHQDGADEVDSVALDGSHEQNLTRNPGSRDAMGGPTVARDGQIIYAAASYQSAAVSPFVRERLGLAALVVQSVLLALGAALLFVGNAVRPGSLTVLVGAATVVALALGESAAWAFLPAALLAGVAADIAWLALRTRTPPRLARATAVGVLTGVYVAGHLATVAWYGITQWPAGWLQGEPWRVSGVGYAPEFVALLVLVATGIGVVIGLVTGASEPVAVGGGLSSA
ncbi:MAG TPA: hypothetical protein VGO32_07150 [Candidatus Limnocylindria bacterium]|nr:hypothetical protein [Candidatus Limnocylindria bacterium]